LAELAYHYHRGDNVDKAVEYLGRAGRHSVQCAAYGDAIDRLTAAIDLLQNLPDRPERTQRELLLQLAVGPALNAVKGFALSEWSELTHARETFVSG
jgi:predicted ATPase